ncbi:MAG: hypothetical protein ABIP94_17990, partial [Planctomycetota bacterium]
MRHLLLCLPPLAAFAFALPFSLSPQEPPLRVNLRIGEQTCALVDGQEATIEIAGQPTKVMVSVDASRRFDADAAGVQFDYPRHMRFELDEDEDGSRDWTLDGLDCEIYVYQLRGDGARTFAERFVAALIGKLCGLDGDAQVT